MRQCDKLDGLVDGIMNNYMACRAIFDVKQGKSGRHPWAAKRCPNNVDPNPADTSANACLTDGQISTLEFVYSRYPFAAPLANGVKSFGMWLPNTDPSGSGLIVRRASAGRKARPRMPAMHSHLGIAGRHGVPDEGSLGEPARLCGRRQVGRAPRGDFRRGWMRPIPICPRSRSAAAR